MLGKIMNVVLWFFIPFFFMMMVGLGLVIISDILFVAVDGDKVATSPFFLLGYIVVSLIVAMLVFGRYAKH